MFSYIFTLRKKKKTEDMENLDLIKGNFMELWLYEQFTKWLKSMEYVY